MKDRLLYSMIDSRFHVSARIQHRLISEFAVEMDFNIAFYGAEDPEFNDSSPYLAEKLPRLVSKYHGIIFFSLYQLTAEESIKTIRLILDAGLKVLFACQRIFISDHNEFEREKVAILAAATASKAGSLSLIKTAFPEVARQN